jgi:hypothetical protein
VDDNGTRAVGLDLPAVLADFLDGEGRALIAAAIRGEVFDVTGVFAHEVGAGGPDGHHQGDVGLAGCGDEGFDFDVMSLGRGESEGVLDRRERCVDGCGRLGHGGNQEHEGENQCGEVGTFQAVHGG